MRGIEHRKENPIREFIKLRLAEQKWRIRRLSIEEPDRQAMYSLVNALKKNDPERRRLKVRDRLWDVGWMIGRASGKEEIGVPRTLDPTITQSDAREIVEGMRQEFGFGSVDSFEKAVRIYCEHFEKKVPT